jgi:hypothetical protein
MLGGTWATNNQTRTVFALGFEIEEIEDGAFAVVAILLSGERVVLNPTFDSENEAHARIRELAQTLGAVNV